MLSAGIAVSSFRRAQRAPLFYCCWISLLRICSKQQPHYFTATALTVPLSPQRALLRTSTCTFTRHSRNLSRYNPCTNTGRNINTMTGASPRRSARRRADDDEGGDTKENASNKEKQQEEKRKIPPKKKSTATKIKLDKGEANISSLTKKKASPAKKNSKLVAATPGNKKEEQEPNEESSPPPSKKKKSSPVKKKAKPTKGSKKEGATGTNAGAKKAPQKMAPDAKKAPKKKAADHQRLTERDDLPKLWNPKGSDQSHTFTIVSWNVAGLRAVMRNHPTALADLAATYNADVICLQETKLQEMHVDDPKLKIKGYLLEEQGYDSHYSCSTTKKGYSGTCVFVKRRSNDNTDKTKQTQSASKKKQQKQATLGNFFASSKEKAAPASREAVDTIANTDNNLVPHSVSMKMGKDKHDGEGRIITVDYPLFSITNLYVPNSGQKLERLDYRTKEWDTDLLEFMQKKEADRGVPVIWLGDLNVAHTAMEAWNEGAKHLAKSAGTTPEERESFQNQLDAASAGGGGYVDAFRRLHPTAQGQYTYWSQRAGNREPNKGLRLDYFICSNSLFENDSDDGSSNNAATIRDCYIAQDQIGSDHCPIVLELEIKKKK